MKVIDKIEAFIHNNKIYAKCSPEERNDIDTALKVERDQIIMLTYDLEKSCEKNEQLVEENKKLLERVKRLEERA